MRSVFIADGQRSHAGTAAVPLPVPTTQPESTSGILLLLFVGWTIAGLIAARLLGVFRRNSIRGPERLRHDEIVWWLLMILCGSALIGGRLVSYLQRVDFHLPKDGKTLLDSGSGEAFIVILIIILSAFFRTDAIRLIGIRLRQIPGGVLGGVITILITFPLVCLCESLVTAIYIHFHLKQADAHELLQLMESTKDKRVLWIAIITATLVAPFFEEMIFRGMIQTMLGRMFSFAFGPPRPEEQIQSTGASTVPSATAPGAKIVLDYKSPQAAAEEPNPPTVGPRARWAAVVMTSVIFAAIHMEPAFMPPIFVLALGLGYVYERTGNLWTNITAHSLFNMVQILIFFQFHA